MQKPAKWSCNNCITLFQKGVKIFVKSAQVDSCVDRLLVKYMWLPIIHCFNNSTHKHAFAHFLTSFEVVHHLFLKKSDAKTWITCSNGAYGENWIQDTTSTTVTIILTALSYDFQGTSKPHKIKTTTTLFRTVSNI